MAGNTLTIQIMRYPLFHRLDGAAKLFFTSTILSQINPYTSVADVLDKLSDRFLDLGNQDRSASFAAQHASETAIEREIVEKFYTQFKCKLQDLQSHWDGNCTKLSIEPTSCFETD